jgi:hypothetical protein
VIAIGFTETADGTFLFYWTIPEMNSTQYPLMPRVDLYNGFLTWVEIRITWPAVTWFIENVIVDKSDEI